MRSDNHSVSDQMKSGFFIVCQLVLGFFVFVLAVGGLSRLYSTPLSHDFLGFFAALIVVCLAATVMFVTAHRWGGFIAGFFFLPGALRAFGAFLSGYDYDYPPRPLSRLESGLFVVYCIAVISLVWRFVGRRRRHTALTLLDRTALTSFVLAIGVYTDHPQSYAGPIGGFVALVIAWVVFRWQHRKSGRREPMPARSEP